jgi:hypothetical protein
MVDDKFAAEAERFANYYVHIEDILLTGPNFEQLAECGNPGAAEEIFGTIHRTGVDFPDLSHLDDVIGLCDQLLQDGLVDMVSYRKVWQRSAENMARIAPYLVGLSGKEISHDDYGILPTLNCVSMALYLADYIRRQTTDDGFLRNLGPDEQAHLVKLIKDKKTLTRPDSARVAAPAIKTPTPLAL